MAAEREIKAEAREQQRQASVRFSQHRYRLHYLGPHFLEVYVWRVLVKISGTTKIQPSHFVPRRLIW